MFTVCGHAVIMQLINERTVNGSGFYFNLEVVTQHPRRKSTPENPEAGRIYQKVSIFVPKDKGEEARLRLEKGTNFIVRRGELTSSKTPQGSIFAEVQCHWNDIQFLRMIPE